MRFACVRGRHRLGNAECQDTRFRLLTQTVELLVLAIIVTNRRRREPNVALWFANEPPDRREGAAILHRGDHLLVQYRAIRNAIDPFGKMLPEPLGHIVTTVDDNIGAKCLDEVSIGG